MAIIESNLGNIEGKIGNNLFAYTRMGKTILRKSPGKRKKSSEGQKTCMNNFSLMSMTYSYVKRVLQLPIWKLAGKEYGKTANNYFSHVNKGIFDKNGEVRDHDELVLSEGSLLNPSGMTIEHTGESTYKISWIPENENTTGAADDQLMVLVYTENVPRYFSIRWADNTTGTRAEGTGTFTIPPTMGKEDLHVYCFFGSSDGNAYSRSKHFRI
ncbi:MULTISPECIES: DUF6266 family protein [Butyricimonas]|uniref:DUF6266 family protein n=1 Tax=Butyricimonas TaxID=574697 RepID=UPI000374507F|nr:MULTISPECIES: DUF6266 family protein [Butyricimonas]